MKRIAAFAAICLIAGTVNAAEMGLTSVLYPDGKKVDVPLSGTSKAPAAEVKAVVHHQAGQSTIQIDYKNLPPAVLFGGDIVSYVVWAVAPDGTSENLGGIANETDKGTGTYSTATRDFAVMITAEPIVTVSSPTALVVFFSGTPAMKDLKPTTFNYTGLSTREGYISWENDSIAGMSYKADKTNPLELIQAEKAIELLDRFEAKKYDERSYTGAMTAIGTAREMKGSKRTEACKETIVRAGHALRQTATMMQAEAEAAKMEEMTARTQAIASIASGLDANLEATNSKLAATEAQLKQAQTQIARNQSEMRRMQANEAQVKRQRDAVADQLIGALGSMAVGSETDRGLKVSLTGGAFSSGKSELFTDAKYILAKVSGMLLAFPDMKLQIEGYTDSTGKEEFNRKLSLDRANAVKTFLGEMGVSEGRMVATGFGPDNPVAPNDTPEGRAKNRRVDILLAGDR